MKKKLGTQSAIKNSKSGICRSDPPNFVSHNANLNVKKGYIMFSRELAKIVS